MTDTTLQALLNSPLFNKSKPEQIRLAFIATVAVTSCMLALVGSVYLEGQDQSVPAKLTPYPVNPAEDYPGGETSVSTTPFASFEKPVQNLPMARKPDFYAGKALANQPWIKAPTSTTDRDGLGPIYNARTCLACHVNGGRGLIPSDNHQRLFSAFVRISLPGKHQILGVNPEPTYGDQLQTQSVSLAHQLQQIPQANSVSNEVMPEAYVYINWINSRFTYGDGRSVSLRSPELDIRQLNYGPLHAGTITSLRVAPAILGAGLIERIAQSEIDQLADPNDENNDGISGRVNRVWDVSSQQTMPGRFGLKANRPNLKMVVAAAFANDVGISNALFPSQPCTVLELECLRQPNGNDEAGFEISDELLQLVIEFTRNLAVPLRRNSKDAQVIQGRGLFYQSGCADCHHPNYVTMSSADNPHLSDQTIWPYSDFLLHDMGPGLADGRSDFLASGSEWRTPPLWGIGLNTAVNGSDNLLHDGRARSVEEAILWHGGEANRAKQSFTKLSHDNRQSLIRFVESL